MLPVEEYERRLRRANSKVPHLWSLLDAVKDPEIPVVSIWGLGILRDVTQDRANGVGVTITTTYSGCPAMETIVEDITDTLAAAGYPNTQVVTSLHPAWSSSWILPQARDALRAFGIAPPAEDNAVRQIICPQCRCGDVECISEFGSTACKALYRCRRCQEPFDYFKAI